MGVRGGGGVVFCVNAGSGPYKWVVRIYMVTGVGDQEVPISNV